MNINSLRFRITSWYVGLLGTSLLLFGALLYFGLKNYLDTSLQNSLTEQAENIGSKFLSQAEQRGESFVVGEINESYAPETNGRFIRVLRPNGSVLYQSADAVDPHIIAADIPMPAIGSQSQFSNFVQPSNSGKLVLYVTHYKAPNGALFTLQTGASYRPADRILDNLLITLLLLTPFVLGTAAVGGYMLMKQPLKPVVALTEHAERVGAQTLGERLPIIASGDELERLSLSLNRMIERLEDALTHIHRFSMDVSHELRTPLTILRGEFEHLVQRPKMDEPVLEAIGSALEEIDRMSKIVDGMLAISRLDSGGIQLERSAVDIRPLAISVVEHMRLLADEKHIELQCIDHGPVFVLGDATRIKQVLVNLVDNAIKYTSIGGMVEVSFWEDHNKDAGVGVMQVKDNGIGIPAESLPFVFERFYRADKARTRDNGGAGLGLSIVRSICSALGGTVTVQSVEGQGATFHVELQLQPLQVVKGSATSTETEEEVALKVSDQS